MVLDLIQNFVLFDGGIKKVPRFHQFQGIKAAQEKCEAQTYPQGTTMPEFRVGIGDTMPFESDTIACAAMLDVIEHLNNPIAHLSNLKRFLNPGGLLVVEIPHSPVREFKELPPFELDKVFNNVHLFHFSRKNVGLLAQKLGMQQLLCNVFHKVEMLPGFNVFAVYPGATQRGMAYRLGSLFNLGWLYLKGMLGGSIHTVFDENVKPFGDGHWLRFMLKN